MEHTKSLPPKRAPSQRSQARSRPRPSTTSRTKLFTILKSTYFNDGQQYGYLACVIPEEKYSVVIANAKWTYAAPINPGAYAATALGAGVSAAQQEQIIANHKDNQTSYAKYLGVQEARKELILYGVGDDLLAPLKKQHINFGDAIIHSMIKRLREKTAIKMTTSQKYEYKKEGYKKPWDPTMSITAYFTGLDKFQISLADRGISTSVKEKAMAAGARMWESKMFTEDQMVAWENRPAADQMWTNIQTYFTEKWLERPQYLAAMVKQSRFKEAALAAQEQAAATEEGEPQAMMFALLQEQHQLQFESMLAENKATTETMMEQINALVPAQGGTQSPADKENTPPLTNSGKKNKQDIKPRGPRCKLTLCPYCKALVYHKADKWYELKSNKDKRWVGWKLIKETTA
jgi:hypothetical protein